MNLLLPLGLLGLLSILVLILIYILKPNYQQKIISSTFVWKLSLKYRKKRIPISKLRNILLIICQVLILTGLSFVLTKPVIEGEKFKVNEKILVIDASASMLLSYDGESRFERAVSQVKTAAEEVLADNGVVSIIVADPEPYFVVRRSGVDDLVNVQNKLDELLIENTACSYDSANMDAAVEMAQEVMDENPVSQTYLYTATTYIDVNNIEVVPVGYEEEWNAAILDGRAVMGDDNYYSILVDIGCYNRSEAITVYCEVKNPNGKGGSIVLESDEEFFSVAEEEKTIEFTSKMQQDQKGYALYSFEYLYIYIEEADHFSVDNSYYLYGGKKEELKVQYASLYPNNFFRSGIYTLREVLKDVWDIEFDEVLIDPKAEKPEYATEDYDIYIFEHTVPQRLPEDGIVVVVNPDVGPANSGIRLESSPVYVDPNTTLSMGDSHPLTSYLTAEMITVAKYGKVISNDGYDELMYCGKDPVMLAKNEPDEKIVILTLDLNFSNFSMLLDFPTFLYNIFQYYMPPTLTDYSYKVGETVTLNARGTSLSVSGGDIDMELTEFPSEIKVDEPGVYTLTQVDIAGTFIIENFFVGIPKTESNITKEVDALPLLYIEANIEREDKDLLVYFAAAIVALLFIEWWLQSREYF